MMGKSMITALVQALFTVLNKERIIAFCDAGLNAVERKVKETPNKYDDLVVLPACKMLRGTFGIPDSDLDDDGIPDVDEKPEDVTS